MVTKFPNHWWASSCPTTSATHCLEDEQEFLGSMSSAVSLVNNTRWRLADDRSSGSGSAAGPARHQVNWTQLLSFMKL